MLVKDLLLRNRYLIRRQIGRGSTGAVYQATDLRLDNDVAVKQIIHQGKQVRHAFGQEARFLARLRHPALPKVIDHFTGDEGQFLVMEFIPGDDLATAALKRLDPFPLEQIIEWAIQLLRVLVYLHGQQPPIIHRDIKPHNLKLMANGEIILLDFGLAKGERPVPGATDGLTGYTSFYAAPEQILGQTTDPRSDLYSLAATLYDLATGVKPPDAVRHRQQALADGRSDPLQPASEIQPTIPTAVSQVWQRAMALNPDERFASAQDMLTALHSALAARTAVPHNLPAQYTTLVGRQAEIQAVRQRLTQDGVRLLTLTGTAGIGKTRLGLQCAAVLLDHFQDGVFFVPLAPLRDAALIAASIAQALGVKETGARSHFQRVQEWLGDKQVLLLLDNFEHVLEAARLVTDLLAACPRLSVLVTSRETLHLRGEHEFPVSPLALPDRRQHLSLTEAVRFTAVQLFTQRARAANLHFELNDGNVTAVADICNRVDGLPLAIELAAAHVKTQTPAQILARLADRFELLRGGARDLPPRQQALQAALDWSHDLLSPAGKKLFRRLAVFAGGFTLETAMAVCQAAADDDLEPLALEVADGLASLVDKNLAQRRAGTNEEPRYTMLVTVQAYAAEQLAESGEAAALRQRHANYYLVLAEQAMPKLTGSAPETWFDRLEVEHDNLRAVLQWAIAYSEVEVGLRLGYALWRFWQTRGHYTEGRQWLEKLLAIDVTVPPEIRAKALKAAGNLSLEQGDLDRAGQLHEEAYHLWQRLEDELGLATVLNDLAIVALYRGEYEQAKSQLEASLALSQTLPQPQRITGHAHNNLGITALYQGRYDQAIASFEESVALFQAVGDKRATSLPLGNLAQALHGQSDYERALATLQESYALRQKLGDRQGVAVTLKDFGLIHLEQGEYEAATRYFNEALTICRADNYSLHIGFILHHLALAALYQGRVDEAAVSLEQSLALFRSTGDKRGVAHAHNELGLVARVKGDYQEATMLHQKALALRREIADEQGLISSLQDLGYLANEQGELDQAIAYYRESLALARKHGQKLGLACGLEGMAGAICQIQSERAARLFGAADALRTALGTPLPPVVRFAYERDLATVRAALGKDGFATAWAEGQRMELETAVRLALHEE